MKFSTAAVVVAAACMAKMASAHRELSFVGTIDIDDHSVDTYTRFKSWMKAFDKKYDDAEFMSRYAKFVKTDEFIKSHNVSAQGAPDRLAGARCRCRSG